MEGLSQSVIIVIEGYGTVKDGFWDESLILFVLASGPLKRVSCNTLKASGDRRWYLYAKRHEMMVVVFDIWR